MLTEAPRKAIRRLLRRQALAQWSQRPVQGKIARMRRRIFTPALDLRLYVCCSIPRRWQGWLMPQDEDTVDLSLVRYRTLRAIGGGWTEKLHVDPALSESAEAWREQIGMATVRTCPLCRQGAGTPRHVVMQCNAMAGLVDQLRDMLETELSQGSEAISLEAEAWRAMMIQDGKGHVLASHSAEAYARWPLLCKWQWMVPALAREAVLGADLGGHSQAGVDAEAECDLGYRGVLARALGRAVCHSSTSATQPDEAAEESGDESFANIRNMGEITTEVRRSARRLLPHTAAVELTTLLLLGLRAIRVEYAKRIGAFCQGAQVLLAPPPAPVVAAPNTGALEQWLRSVTGQRVVRELRWLAPAPSTLAARIKKELPGFRCDVTTLVARVQLHGVPVRTADGGYSWGPGTIDWDEARGALQISCSCRAPPHHDRHQACWQCGGVRLSTAPSHGPALPCVWCSQQGGAACSGCNRAFHHRGACRWNAGAASAFGQQPHEVRAVCPDCAWDWVKQLRSSPRRPPVLVQDSDLLRHVRAMAVAVHHGAGAAVAQLLHQRPPMRRLRRFILGHLRARGELGSDLAAITREATAYLGPGPTEHEVSEWVNQSIRCLGREGRLTATSNGSTITLLT